MDSQKPSGANINTVILIGGFIVTLMTIVFGGGQTFAELHAADKAATERADVQARQIEAIQTDRQRRMAETDQWKREHEIRVRSLEVAGAGISTRLGSIEDGIAEIKDLIREGNGVRP